MSLIGRQGFGLGFGGLRVLDPLLVANDGKWESNTSVRRMLTDLLILGIRSSTHTKFECPKNVNFEKCLASKK